MSQYVEATWTVTHRALLEDVTEKWTPDERQNLLNGDEEAKEQADVALWLIGRARGFDNVEHSEVRVFEK